MVFLAQLPRDLGFNTVIQILDLDIYFLNFWLEVKFLFVMIPSARNGEAGSEWFQPLEVKLYLAWL